MHEPREPAVWVSGERYNVDYLFDVGDGRVLRRVELEHAGGTTAGVGRECSGAFVAVWVSRGQESLNLQIGADRLTLDERVRATHRLLWKGLISELTVEVDGRVELQAQCARGVAGFLLRRLDPTWDELDELGDDFLADVADIVNSPERREWMLQVKDPDAGPWAA